MLRCFRVLGSRPDASSQAPPCWEFSTQLATLGRGERSRAAGDRQQQFRSAAGERIAAPGIACPSDVGSMRIVPRCPMLPPIGEHQIDEHNTVDQAYNAQQWAVPDHNDTIISTLLLAQCKSRQRSKLAAALAPRQPRGALDHSPKMGFALPSLPDINCPPSSVHLPGM